MAPDPEEELAALVDEGGQVRVLEQGDDRRALRDVGAERDLAAGTAPAGLGCRSIVKLAMRSCTRSSRSRAGRVTPAVPCTVFVLACAPAFFLSYAASNRCFARPTHPMRTLAS